MKYLQKTLMIVFMITIFIETANSGQFVTCERLGGNPWSPKSIEIYKSSNNTIPRVLPKINIANFKKSFFSTKLTYKYGKFEKGFLNGCLILKIDKIQQPPFLVQGSVSQSCTNDKWYGYIKYKCVNHDLWISNKYKDKENEYIKHESLDY